MNLFDLTGRVALVTAGSSGSRRAMSLGLADTGAAEVVTSRRRDACERFVDEIRAAGRQGRASGSQLRAEGQNCVGV